LRFVKTIEQERDETFIHNRKVAGLPVFQINASVLINLVAGRLQHGLDAKQFQNGRARPE
jgi:DNA phosphorothioation-dependent restriction protein DptG